MEYGVREVMTLFIFDEKGKYITTLDTLKRTYLHIQNREKAYIEIKDALLNFELLKFINNVKDEELSDYENYKSINKPKTITISSKYMDTGVTGVPCKILARGMFRDTNNKDSLCILEIPNAYIPNSFDLLTDGNEASDFSRKIFINPDDNEDLVSIKIYD